MDQARPHASIIVVARDEEHNLGECLNAVIAQRAPWPFEVIVVDSGSRDCTAQVARSFGARVIEIPREDFQHGRTRQMASEQARGEYLLYLVADARPLNRHWLQRLVEAVSCDDTVAGAYSRQTPREAAGPLEAHRLRHRGSAGKTREVRRIGPGLDFWALPPMERLRWCEFDDVSACRRASLLLAHPIPEVDWAEDLAWAKEVLLAGKALVFEPESVVVHSHADTVSHAFRRGYLDQTAALTHCGVVYFHGLRALASGYPRILAEQAMVIVRSPHPMIQRAWLLGWNVARLAAETAGNFAASRKPRRTHVAHDLIGPLTRRSLLGRRHRDQVLETSFTLGSDPRRVVFMNPNAAAAVKVKVPPRAILRFAVGINPEVRGRLHAPVTFAVAINGELVWTRTVEDGARDQEPRWEEGEIDLTDRAGQKARIIFLTRSEVTDHAWAGWARPRIETPDLTGPDRLVNRILEWARGRVMGAPLRHP